MPTLSSKVVKADGPVAELLQVSEAEAAEKTGARVAAGLREALAKGPYASLGIAGGSAAKALPFARKLLGAKWAQVRLTWVDERCVDFASADSNRGSAYRSEALSQEDPPDLELPLWLDGESAESAEARVAEALVKQFEGRLDVTLLGMGPDGHIASLFPGHRLLSLPSDRLVATLSDSPKPPNERITLTRTFLERSGANILLALGQAKEPALRKLLAKDEDLPASHLSNLTILTNLDMGAVA